MDGSDIGTQSGLRIGRVIAVSASQAVALLERCDDSGGPDRAWPVEMGALVKMHTRVSTVYGMVSGMRVPLPNLSPSDQELKVVELELAGETLIEAHSEYAAAFGDKGMVLSPGEGLYLPYWLFNFEEIVEIVLGSDYQPEQAKILGDAILAAKQSYFARSGLDKTGTVDTPVPYRMSEVIRHLDTAMGALDRPENVGAVQALQQRLQALQSDARYGFVFGQRLTVRDELSAILSQLLRIPVDGKPVTILDVSGIPSEVLNVVVSVLCRLTFDFALWSETPVPITIVCEEAHRYAPRDTGLGFEPAKRALSRIAKEGRKYGVSLCVVTQRPSDLAPGLLSECNTIFALRMTNHDDQEIVRGAVPEASHGLMNFLPALRNGEAIAAGEGVSMPMRVCFDVLPDDRRPRSATASFTGAWSEESEASQVERAVERWRRGVRHAA